MYSMQEHTSICVDVKICVLEALRYLDCVKNLLYLCRKFITSLSISGGLQTIAELMQLEQELYGRQNEPMNMALRRYAGMALTNLTYGDVVNKVI